MVATKSDLLLLPEGNLKALFPFASRFIKISGYNLHYIDEGPRDGEVVLLLHGNPTWSFYYRNLISTLKDHFRIIAPDFIGLGLSDHPSDVTFRAADRLEHLSEFLNQIKINSLSIVMHDWGGSIGSGYAVRNPEKIRRLIYLNTTLTETESLPFIIKRATQPIIGRFLTQTTKHFLKLTTEWGVKAKLPPDVKKAYLFPYATKARRRAIWDFVADIPFDSQHPTYAEMMFLADNLPQLSNVPVLIVWGLEDPCFHREMLSQVARHFPHAEVVEVPDASHLVLEDAPEIVCPAIRSFLLGDIENVVLAQAQQHDSGLTDNGKKNFGRFSFSSGKNLIAQKHPLYHAFLEQVMHDPRNEAVVEVKSWLGDLQYSPTTYQDLATLINKYQRGLNKLGLVSGDRVVMLVEPGREFLALTYAIMARGGIPVFLDPGMGVKNLLKCIEEVAPQVFIGSLKAQLLRVINKKIFQRIKFSLTASRFSFIRGKDLGYLQRFSANELPPVAASETSLIAFTSGATGVPKGVVYTCKMIEAQLNIFKDHFEIKAGGRDLPLLPVFSIYNLALGATSVFPPINPAKPLALDPRMIINVIKDQKITSAFGSPTLWAKIAEFAIRAREELPSLKRIFSAGAAVPINVLERVKEMMQNGEVYTPYGATEALPVTLTSASELLQSDAVEAANGGVGVDVGVALPELDVKVVEVNDQNGSYRELPELEIGEIIVNGANVSPRYFQREEATRQAKLFQSDGSFWHRMGDLAYLAPVNGQKRLFLVGRKVHSIFYNYKWHHSLIIEKIFDKNTKVRRSALIKLSPSGEPAIAIEPHPQFWPDGNEKRGEFNKELENIAKQSELTAQITKFFFFKLFPVDARHNAKIFRDKLGEEASQ